MAWTFPTAEGVATAAGLRHLLAAAAGALIAGLRAGAPPARRLHAAGPPAAGHFHHMPELFIQLQGRSRFATSDGGIEITPGTLLAVAPLCAHDERIAARPFANLVASLRQGALSVHLARHGRDPLRPMIAVEETLLVADADQGAAAIAALLAAPDDDEAAAWTMAVAAWLRRAAREAPAAASVRDGRVARVQARIHYEIGKTTLTVPGLAAYAGCGPDHLTRRFRRETGEGLAAYIQRVRLEQARELLAAGGRTVAETARLVGIADPAYFSRIYRQRFGRPPSREAVMAAPARPEPPPVPR